MRAVARGLRNLYRTKARTTLVAILLGLSIGVFITMAQVAERTGATASRLETSVETLLEVRAAGATGMGRGVEPLSGDVIQQVRDIPGLRSIEQYLYVRRVDNTRKYPVSVIAGLAPITGVLRVNSHGEVGTPTVIEGRSFGPDDEDQDVAIVGSIYAQQQGLDVGSNLTLGSTSLEVIGIFDAGFVFGNNQVFVPLGVAQDLAYREDYITDRERVSNTFITAETVGQVQELERRLRERLGDIADVLSSQRNAAIAADELDRIQSGGVLGAALSLGISALLVLFTMALITRERTREIGVLKALGAPNAAVIRQFVAEAVGLSTTGAALGFALFAVGAQFMGDRLLGLSATSLTGLTGAMGSQPASDVVTLSVSVTYLGYAAALALGLGVLGSLYPAHSAARMCPAEALRHE